jgi:hypothetical protein
MAARWYGLVRQTLGFAARRHDGGAIAGQTQHLQGFDGLRACGSGAGSMVRRIVESAEASAARRARGRACIAGLAALALADCSSISDSSITVFADPGKYTYYSCEQIAAQTKSWNNREQELRALMDKAEQSTGGAVVNVLAYRADHLAATEELKILEKTARTKNCNPAPAWNSSTAVR